MPEVLLTFESVVQEPDETGIMELGPDETVAEDLFISDAEIDEADGMQQDETVEQPENQVYNISHGDGQKHAGTIEEAMAKCTAMQGKSREEVEQIMSKRAAADRVVQRRREKKSAEAAEKAKASTPEKTERTSDREPAKERKEPKTERDAKATQEANVPVKERPEGAPVTVAGAPDAIPGSARRVSPEKPVKPIVHEQNNGAHEPAVVLSKLPEDAGVDPVVEFPRMGLGVPPGAELSAHQSGPTSVRKDFRPTAESEVPQPPVDTARVTERIEPGVGDSRIVTPFAEFAEAAALHVDTLIAEAAGSGQDSGMTHGEMTALSVDELRQLFGIGVEHDADDATQADIAKTETSLADQSASADAIIEVTNIASAPNSVDELRQLFGISEYDVEEEGSESVLDSEVIDIRQAFFAAGHEGGESLEDLVALDIELNEQVAGGEYTALPAADISELQSEELLSHDLALDAMEDGEDAPAPIILPEVRPELLETNVDADSAVGVRASAEGTGTLQEALQSLEPEQATAVEDFLANAARAVEQLERITESGEGDRVPIEQELEALCSRLFDALGINQSDELIRHFIDGIVSPDTLTIVRDGTLSPLDIALLNYLGTNEYKSDDQASLLKAILQAVRDWLRHQRWLGRCALKLAHGAFPANPMYSLVPA